MERLLVSTASLYLGVLISSCASNGASDAKNQPANAPANGAEISSNYLLTAADVEAMHVMLPYVQPPAILSAATATLVGDAAVQTLVSQVAAMLNQGLLTPTLAPGRTVQVLLSAEDGFALMNSFKQIIIYKQAFNYSAAALLPVLCHEIGHSAQNHIPARVIRLQAPEAQAAQQQVDAACNVFTAAVYRQDTGMMTWNSAAWTTLSQAVKQNAPILGDWIKRQESEADIDGAMICAAMGLPIDSFISGASQSLSQPAQVPFGIKFGIKMDSKGALDVSAAVDGTQVAMPQSEVKSFCGVADHPGGQERLDQLNRLKPQLAKYYDPTANAAAAFLAQYDPLAQAAKSGLANLFASQSAAAGPQSSAPVAMAPSASEGPVNSIGGQR